MGFFTTTFHVSYYRPLTLDEYESLTGEACRVLDAVIERYKKRGYLRYWYHIKIARFMKKAIENDALIEDKPWVDYEENICPYVISPLWNEIYSDDIDEDGSPILCLFPKYKTRFRPMDRLFVKLKHEEDYIIKRPIRDRFMLMGRADYISYFNVKAIDFTIQSEYSEKYKGYFCNSFFDLHENGLMVFEQKGRRSRI